MKDNIFNISRSFVKIYFLVITISFSSNVIAADKLKSLFDLTPSQTRWGSKYVVFVSSSNLSAIGFIDTGTETVNVEKLFGVAGLDSHGNFAQAWNTTPVTALSSCDKTVADCDGSVGTAKTSTNNIANRRLAGQNITLPITSAVQGLLPNNYLEQSVSTNYADAYHLDEQQYEAAKQAALKLSVSNTSYKTIGSDERDDMTFFLSELSNTVANSINATLINYDSSSNALGLGQTGVPLLAQLETADQSRRRFTWTSLQDLSITKLEKYDITITDKDKRKAIKTSNPDETAAFVRFNRFKNIDDYVIYCLAGEIVDQKPEGPALLYLSSKCDSSKVMAVIFSAGVVDGPVVVNRHKQLVADGSIVAGKRNGVWNEYSFNNVILSSETFENGFPSDGPMILAQVKHPLFYGMRSAVYSHLIGHRSNNITENWTEVSVAYKETLEDGTKVYFSFPTLFVEKNGHVGQYTAKQSSGMSPFIVDGPCSITSPDGTVTSGQCKESVTLKVIRRFMSGACTTNYPDGRTLSAQCDKSGIVPGAGAGFLTGDGIDSQWVNIEENGSYFYEEPSSFKRTWDAVRKTVVKTAKLYHDPKSWFDPRVWEDTADKVVAEFDRVMEKNPDIAKTIEKVCGPKTGGCEFASSEFGAGKQTLSYDTHLSPSGKRETVSVGFGGYRSIAQAHAVNAGDIADNLAYQLSLLQLARFAKSSNLARAAIYKTLKPGEKANVECSIQHDNVLECWQSDPNQARLHDPNKRYINTVVHGPLDPYFPFTKKQKIEWEREMINSLPEWMTQETNNATQLH